MSGDARGAQVEDSEASSSWAAGDVDLETTLSEMGRAGLHRASDEEIVHAMRRMVAHVEFPCLGAKSVFRQDGVTYAVLGHMDDPDVPADLLRGLTAFAADIEGDDGFHSFIAVFRAPVPADEQTFEASLFSLLQRLHDADRQPWAPGVDADPANPHFAFSVGGTAYFIVGLHPTASRVARRAPLATLVFNPHEQFETLRDEGRYDGMRSTIRRRDVDLQGSVNPMVADHGESTEALQYSGRRHDAGWAPPLDTDDAVGTTTEHPEGERA